MPALDTLVTGSKLTAIADAIRERAGTSGRMTLGQMPAAIAAIPAGGGPNAIASQVLYRGYSTTPDSNVDVTAEDFGDEGANTIIRAMAFAVDGPSYRSSQRLRSVEIPSWVTQVDYRAFYYSAITSLLAPGDAVLTLGQGVFMYATGLTALSVERPVELYSYGSQFSMCTGLASVDQEIRAKSGTTYVPGNCFSGCTALASVRLRSTATALSVATRAFGGCTALMELVLDFGAVASLTNTSLTGVPDGCAIYVRDALVDSYKAAANWSARADHILPLSDWEGA
ncbi:MAG: leucine-rich repeat protein [Atopobiaceae bacterium]|nr:leucine-rich repeat protein [Atopobiaceae bacterium]MBR1829787.1 leucine-rich repeat protein [Atopobiaceae bacterium]